jgi:hypothetical protein
MTHELAAGERGSFVVGGRCAGPVKLGLGVLLGVFLATVIGSAIRSETSYLDPANDYFPFAISVLLVIALTPPIVFWSFLGKECIHLILDRDKRKMTLWFQGLTGTWSEDLDFDKALNFGVDQGGTGTGRFWRLRLDQKEGRPIEVAKFRLREDAESEKQQANAVLHHVASSWKGDTPPPSIASAE